MPLDGTVRDATPETATHCRAERLWLCLDPTVIPATVKAQISMRIVPDQDNIIKVYPRTQFDAL